MVRQQTRLPRRHVFPMRYPFPNIDVDPTYVGDVIELLGLAMAACPAYVLGESVPG
jgi:hypothetical protein